MKTIFKCAVFDMLFLTLQALLSHIPVFLLIAGSQVALGVFDLEACFLLHRLGQRLWWTGNRQSLTFTCTVWIIVMENNKIWGLIEIQHSSTLNLSCGLGGPFQSITNVSIWFSTTSPKSVREWSETKGQELKWEHTAVDDFSWSSRTTSSVWRFLMWR